MLRASLPLWVTIPGTVGGSLMGAFSSQFPEGLQRIGFAVGVLLASFSFIGLILHVAIERGALKLALPRLTGQSLDYARWDGVDEFELYQAASLWVDREPQMPMSSSARAKYREWLPDIEGGGWPLQGDVSCSPCTPYLKVHRAVLEAQAEEEGVKPNFLYPEERE